jgi:hypothetical protein
MTSPHFVLSPWSRAQNVALAIYFSPRYIMMVIVLVNAQSLVTIKRRHEIYSNLVCGHIDVIATYSTGKIEIKQLGG